MPHLRRILLLSAALTVAAALPAPAVAAIDAAGVSAHLRSLGDIAAAAGGTRASGTAGDRPSVDYIADRMRSYGYAVTLQPVPFPYFSESRPPVAGPLRGSRELVTARYSGAGSVRARIREFPRGCRANGYRGLRRGQIALVGYPACRYRAAAKHAQAAGASALVLAAPGTPRAGTLIRPGIRIPVVFTTIRGARRLLRQGRVTVDVAATTERRVSHNVIAERGAAKRVVMAGGHLDSVPEGAGINDNGSGVAALLEIAEELAAAPPAGATVRFGFWTAEEWGLFGSEHYVRTLPRAERRRLRVYLNLDMVGSPNAVPFFYGSRRVRAVLHRKLRPSVRSTITGVSDDGAFVKRGIPAGGYYTGSTERKTPRQARRFGGRAGRELDPCYHRACDDISNVDVGTVVRIGRASLRALRAFAQG